MAGIPLFTPDYLSSPTMMGAITPTTARIMSETGKQIQASIEKNNQVLEAKAKAPQIAQLMGSGLQALSSGDMGGFTAIAQAKALGASNPFLAKMSDDALSTGARMANSYLETELFKQKTAAGDENALEQMDRARYNDWDTQRRSIMSEDQKKAKEYEEAVAGYQRQKELGDTSAKPPTPPSRSAVPPPPQFQSKAYRGYSTGQDSAAAPLPGGGGASQPNSLFNTKGDPNESLDMSMVPPGTDAAPVEGGPVSPVANKPTVLPSPPGPIEGELPVQTAQQGPSPIGPQQPAPAPTQSAAPAASPSPETKPLVNESQSDKDLKAASTAPIDPSKPRPPMASDNALAVPFGITNIRINTPDAKQLASRTETVKTETGSVTYRIKPANEDSAKPAHRLAVVTGETANLDPDFATYASGQMKRKFEVTVSPNPNDDKAPWIVKSTSGEPFVQPNAAAVQKPDDDSIPKTIARGVSPEVGKRWTEARGIISSLPKGTVSFDFPKTTNDVVADQQKRIETITDPADREAKRQAINRVNKSMGLPEIPEPKKPADVSPETKKRLEAEGIKDPADKNKPKVADKKADAAEPEKIDDRIKMLRRQVAQLKRKYSDDPMVFDQLAKKQEELDDLQKNYKKYKREESEDRELMASSSFEG